MHEPDERAAFESWLDKLDRSKTEEDERLFDAWCAGQEAILNHPIDTLKKEKKQ